MVGQCPREITFCLTKSSQQFKHSFRPVKILVPRFCPVMSQRDPSPRIGIVLTGDEIHQSHRTLIEIHEGNVRFPASVCPYPAGINFVVNNPLMNSPVNAIVARPPLSHQIQDRTVVFDPCSRGDVRHCIFSLAYRLRMGQQFGIRIFGSSGIGDQQNGRNHYAILFGFAKCVIQPL